MKRTIIVIAAVLCLACQSEEQGEDSLTATPDAISDPTSWQASEHQIKTICEQDISCVGEIRDVMENNLELCIGTYQELIDHPEHYEVPAWVWEMTWDCTVDHWDDCEAYENCLDIS